MAHYTQEDLLLKHYVWTIDNRGEAAGSDLGTETLDAMEGYEVLLFANTFLDAYMPDNTVEDLHSLEHIFLNHLPPYMSAKHDIARWLARNAYFITFTKNSKMYRQREQLKK